MSHEALRGWGQTYLHSQWCIFTPAWKAGISDQPNPNEAPTASLLADISSAGIEIAGLSTEEAALEDVFLQLTSGKLSFGIASVAGVNRQRA